MDEAYSSQKKFLDQVCLQEKIFHAYLFYGTKGANDAARYFAQLINCQAEKNKPCLKCDSCKNISNNTFSDLMVIRPMQADSKGNEKKGNDIKIDQIRLAQDFISRTSLSDSYKIVLIEEAHYLNKEAQNCLLKSLEEPKGKTVFVLITQYPDILLPTIVSRCARIFFPFKKGKEEQKQDIYKNQEFANLINSNLAQRFAYVKGLFPEKSKSKSDDFSQLKSYLIAWLNFLRQLLLEKMGVAKDLTNGLGAKINYTPKKIIRVIKKIQTALFSLDFTNVNAKLSVEIILLEL